MWGEDSSPLFSSILIDIMFSFLRKRSKSKAFPSTSVVQFSSFAVALSDVGEIRENNEDSIVFIKPHDEHTQIEKGSLAIVCDGMGGHKSGDLASKIGIDKVSEYYYSSKSNVEQSIKDALISAHKSIRKVSTYNARHAKMGTTCTAVVIKEKSVYVAHAGDSRAYLISDENIKQLTKDHTYVQHLYDKGVITLKEKLRHPDRNIVTMVLGTQNEFLPDVYSYKNSFGESDKLLLCSDGLYDYIEDHELKHIVSRHEPATAAETLVDIAKKRGGHDNISVIIVQNKAVNEDITIRNTKEVTE